LKAIEIRRLNPPVKGKKRIIIRAIARPAEQVKSISFDVPWAKGEPYISVHETGMDLPNGTKDLEIEFFTIGTHDYNPAASKGGVIRAFATINDCIAETTMSYADVLLTGNLGALP
jgi:hypothetical protein